MNLTNVKCVNYYRFIATIPFIRVRFDQNNQLVFTCIDLNYKSRCYRLGKQSE